MKKSALDTATALLLLLLTPSVCLGAPSAKLAISARTDGVESDFTAVYYNGNGNNNSASSNAPLLVGNDGGAATGGFRIWSLDNSNTTLEETAHRTPGRTKLVTTVYDVGGNDLIVTIAQSDSLFRIYEAATGKAAAGGEPALAWVLGDWSALCGWKGGRDVEAQQAQNYLYLFGKKQAVQFLLRPSSNGNGDGYEMVEIRSFETPVEASSCAVSTAAGRIYFSGDGDSSVYSFATEETTDAPAISVLGEADDDVTGLAIYVGKAADYIFVGQESSIGVYNTSFTLLGSMTLTGDEDIEIEGLNFYQGATKAYPVGALTYAVESESGKGFGVSSLKEAFETLGLDTNMAYDPRKLPSNVSSAICAECNLNGFCAHARGSRRRADAACSCFAGFNGTACESFTCRNDCSGHGACVGANICECEDGWGGLYCGFNVVQAVVETVANGGDGDDPAIWIHPTDKDESRVITTIKSEAGAGLAVFALNGSLVQTVEAGQPNNVDVIYSFQAGNRTIDLVYAACRADDTLCLFEIAPDGTLQTIAGGSHPTPDDYKVYGSCVYRSRKTGRQYLFVNAKSAEYLQYELKWAEGALQTTLVRNFTGGTGGQVEGCVADEANGWVLIGEEPLALWRYDAEPDAEDEHGFPIGRVGDGFVHADVEGVTLVEGPTADLGFILVSLQGVSGYNVYRRAAPHEYVSTFTIGASTERGIDAVSNTDGITAVGSALGHLFPSGLVVVHDDANELAEGGTSDEASFKLVRLDDVLGEELTGEVDPNWDPRAAISVRTSETPYM